MIVPLNEAAVMLGVGTTRLYQYPEVTNGVITSEMIALRLQLDREKANEILARVGRAETRLDELKAAAVS